MSNPNLNWDQERGHSNPPNICSMSGYAHSPAILNRCGGPTAEELNICGICGSDLTMVRGVWIAISDQQAYMIRTGGK